MRIYGAKSVYRAGREHRVAGKQLSTAQLHQLAQAESSRVTGHAEFPIYVLHRLGFTGAVTPGRP